MATIIFLESICKQQRLRTILWFFRNVIQLTVKQLFVDCLLQKSSLGIAQGCESK